MPGVREQILTERLQSQMCRAVIYITLEVTVTQSIGKLHTKSPRSATPKVSAASTLSGHIQNNYRRHQDFSSFFHVALFGVFNNLVVDLKQGVEPNLNRKPVKTAIFR